MTKTNPEELIKFILEAITEKPNKLSLSKTEEDEIIKIDMKLDSNDIGKVIGKAGTTIWAIRKLAGIAGVQLGKKVLVNIEE